MKLAGMLRVGDFELKLSNATLLVETYARTYSATIRFYDLGGTGDDEVRPSDGPISLSDIGRLTIINADLKGADTARLLTTADLPWSSVAPLARLETADPDEPDGLYHAMNALWDRIRVKRSGIGRAKASKLLHLKRPFAFPILDRDVCQTYSQRYRESGSYWRPIREDLINGADDLQAIRDRLARAKSPDVKLASLLPALRLLDIIAWQRGQRAS